MWRTAASMSASSEECKSLFPFNIAYLEANIRCMVFLAYNRWVVGNRPVIAAVHQRSPGSGKAVAGIHEATALVPFHANVVVVLSLLQRNAPVPLFLASLLLLVVVVAGLELAFLGGRLGGEGAVEGGLGLLHLPGGDEGLLAPPPVGVLFDDVVHESGEGYGLLLVPAQLGVAVVALLHEAEDGIHTSVPGQCKAHCCPQSPEGKLELGQTLDLVFLVLAVAG
jgi:hypothetical protein